MEEINLGKKNIRNFGITVGLVLLVITFFIFIRHNYILLPSAIISLAFFILAYFSPNLLKPVYIFWMRLSFILGWINTRIILFILFYLIFTPIGIILKLFGADLLNEKIDKNRGSYWNRNKKRKFIPVDYERQS